MTTAERGAYLRAIEARFAALRGRGFMISAIDVAVVDQWRTRGIPVSLALRVLEEEVRRFTRAGSGRELPRSLSYFEKPLREAFRRYLERMPSAATDEVEPDADTDDDAALAHLLVETLEAAGKRSTTPAVTRVLREAWRRLTQGIGADQDIWSLTAEVDAAIVEGLHALLAPEARAATETRVSAAVLKEGGAAMSEQARREHACFVRDQLIRAHFDVPELMATLLLP